VVELKEMWHSPSFLPSFVRFTLFGEITFAGCILCQCTNNFAVLLEFKTKEDENKKEMPISENFIPYSRTRHSEILCLYVANPTFRKYNCGQFLPIPNSIPRQELEQ
jgi:hypothetical protein